MMMMMMMIEEEKMKNEKNKKKEGERKEGMKKGGRNRKGREDRERQIDRQRQYSLHIFIPLPPSLHTWLFWQTRVALPLTENRIACLVIPNNIFYDTIHGTSHCYMQTSVIKKTI